MAESDRSTVRLGPGQHVVHVVEVDRPTWGTIVYRSVDDPEVLYVEQLISVGPYKTDVAHAQQLTASQLAAYADDRLDFVGLAEAAMVELNRPVAARRATDAASLESQSDTWVAEHVKAAQSLAGQSVRSWAADEQAIRSNADETQFDFTDPQVPCLQLTALTVESANGSITRFGNHQNNDEFGVTVTADGAALSGKAMDGYRFRWLDELPTGLVTSVATRMSDAGDLTEIEFGFGHEVVLIVAGEIYATATTLLDFHRFDGSLLVFTSRADHDAIDWTPPI